MSKMRANEIDLLRFLAALCVVLFHYAFRGYAADNLTTMPYLTIAPVAKYGYLGVQLFFMISGFVILMTAASGNLKIFIASRIARLYPAYWICCTITFIATAIIGGTRYSASLSQYFYNMSMLNGLIGVRSIDGSYWSLLIELKFYFLIMVVLAIKQIHRSELYLMFWLAATIALLIIPVRILNSTLITDYSVYFISGASYFLIWSNGLSLQRFFIVSIAWATALYQGIHMVPELNRQLNTVYNPFVISTLISLLFIVMLLVALRRTGEFGKRSWITIGALTYPVYLVHHNFGFMVFNLAYPTVNPHIILWGTIIFMLAVAYAINVFIEQKCATSIKAILIFFSDTLLNRVNSLRTRS